jgi:hypothetical protein
MADQDDPGPPGLAEAFRAIHHRLCAHADDGGESIYWLDPDEMCDRERAPDLLGAPGFRRERAYLDEVDVCETSGHED